LQKISDVVPEDLRPLVLESPMIAPDMRRTLPDAIAYFETVRLIIAWCEMRKDFQNFRTDRIFVHELFDDTYPTRTRELRRQCWDQERVRLEAKPGTGQVDFFCPPRRASTRAI
jgi:hypothetical protein